MNVDTIDCTGMTAEEARAALRQHSREIDAARQAERERAARARAANAARLGLNESLIPIRPARYARAVGDALPLTVNGTPARLIRSSARWEGWDTDFPHKVLEGVAVVGRHKVYKLRLVLDGEDLTRETAWLTMRDAVAVGGGRVRFVSGFEAELFPEFMAEVEARDDRAVLAAAADIEAAGAGPGKAATLTPAQRKRNVKAAKAKEQVNKRGVELIVNEYEFTKGKAKRRGEIVAARCASGDWKSPKNEGVRANVERKDGEKITWRYVCDLLKRHKPQKKKRLP